jgi:G3E family GTPase
VDEEQGIDLSKFSYIDSMLTVVDSFNFFKDFCSNEYLMDRQLTDMEGDNRTIVNLLTDQIEFANIIILNKTDLVDRESLGLLEAAIKKLNPTAKIIQSKFGKVDLKNVLNTRLFDFEEAQNSAGWQKELEGGNHSPETEEYGISSFVFRNHKPFHPERYWNYLSNQYPNSIIRSKGLFWLASRPDVAISFSQAGGSSRIESAGVWWASMEFSERIKYPSFIENKSYIEDKWDKNWGDRLTELVFIGQDMNKEQIILDLENCLINAGDNYDLNKVETISDPFPREI